MAAILQHRSLCSQSGLGRQVNKAPALATCALHPTGKASKRTRQPQSSYCPQSAAQGRPVSAVVRASDAANDFDVDVRRNSEPREDTGRDDEVLPEDLADSINQAAAATAEAIRNGNSRCQVEILLPEFWDPISGPIFPNRGDQGRFWRITRRFVEKLAEGLKVPSESVNAVYPDAGVAAMLKHQWSDASEASLEAVRFRLSSLNDRRPIKQEDQLVVLACPDPPGADDALKTIRMVSSQDEEAGRPDRPVVLFNQRLSSGDVGLGLNSRRLRDQVLKNFSITYSLRPIGDVGTVFRCYPGLWKVFIEDPQMPGRYKLIAEKPSRPQVHKHTMSNGRFLQATCVRVLHNMRAGEYLDFLVQEAMNPGQGKEGESQAPGFGSQLARTLNGLQYFMKSLTK